MTPLVTVTPDLLTLNPGESAQVTVQVDPLSDSGDTSVVVGVEVPPRYDYLIAGDFEGTIGPGESAHIVGDVNQTGPVFVEGLLTGIDMFHWQGNGFTVFFQNGGQANLHGKYKAPWGEWDTDTTGWEIGDRLGVAPTAVGKYVPSERVWSDWATPRPVNSPGVTMIDGSIRKPEVVNLDQSIVFENLARGFHFHDSASVQNLSDVKFLNCGTTGVLGSYPVHFHQLYDNSRGSLLERVVVEGGKNHAFVPHASHGVTFKDCVAYKTISNAFWWDPPPDPLPGENDSPTINDTNNVTWDHCLVLHVAPKGVGNSRGAGFDLGRGLSNRCVDSVAACVQGSPNAPEGNRQRSGFAWQEGTSGESWQFQRNLGHNNVDSGILVWQNARVSVNLIEDFTAYNNGFEGINHGSYVNRYHYAGALLTGNGFRQHAKSPPEGPLVIDDILSERRLHVTSHNSSLMFPAFYRRCSFPSVEYHEPSNGSWNIFEDCGLIPSDFNLAGAASSSIIEIKEGGVLTHRWAAGDWS